MDFRMPCDTDRSSVDRDRLQTLSDMHLPPLAQSLTELDVDGKYAMQQIFDVYIKLSSSFTRVLVRPGSAFKPVATY